MRIAILLIPATVLLAAGCSGASTQPAGPVTAHPVTGKVVYDGKAAGGVRLYLLSTDAPSPPAIPRYPAGVTKPDGTFTLTTFTDGDGAPEGGYIVVMNWPKEGFEPGSEEPGADADQLLGWYDAPNSKLQVRIKAGSNVLPPFDLPKRTTPPPPSAGIPGRN